MASAFSIRMMRMVLVFIGCALILLGRLAYWQLVRGEELAKQALEVRLEYAAVFLERGDILDRYGKLLTRDQSRYRVLVFPELLPREAAILERLQQSSLALLKPHEPLTEFFSGISLDQAEAKILNQLAIPGLVVVPERIRTNEQALAAHVIGYVNQSEQRGVSGLERQFDAVLAQAQPRWAGALIDARGALIPGLGYKYVFAGRKTSYKQVVLTLDAGMQAVVEEVLDTAGCRGAVVIIHPRTGEVLAMASRPVFRLAELPQQLQQPDAPFINRAVTAYQPGSVFKLIVAAAGLEAGQVQADTTFFDKGYIDVGNQRFRSWEGESHGTITFRQAMAFSNNPVFIELGLSLGAERLRNMAEQFGLGTAALAGVIEEDNGVLPLLPLYAGELANFSIGQGVCEATPLQMASVVATIANHGIRVEPNLIRGFIDSDGQWQEHLPAVKEKRVIRKETAQTLRNLMGAVTDIGTGQAAKRQGLNIIGKTGSAETGRTDKSGQGISHAWFGGIMGGPHAEYAMVVLVEEGSSGGGVAAPLFGTIAAALAERDLL